MAEESITLSNDQNIEYHILTLFEKIEALRSENVAPGCTTRTPVQVEIRTLEFWRSVISECLSSFVYVLIVCGASEGVGVGASLASVLLATALASGFAMASLTQCFGHISGAHVNPAVTVAMGVTKRISFLRTLMFIFGQCGGGTAGAAFLYGVLIPRFERNVSVSLAYSASITAWERFGIEFVLTFFVVFVYFVCMDTYRKWLNSSCLTIGATYSACSFVSMPYLNPARSLGPSLVLSKWDNHWVYWVGPIVGGIVSGLTYEYIFNPRRHKQQKDTTDGESSSIRSDEDTYDDLDKPVGPKFHGSTYNTYRPTPGGGNGPSGYCPSLTSASLYSAPPTKLERVESLYGGTKSLYCKSPPLTRANLNRSQSVYTKSNNGVNRDAVPKPGPLVPAQSLYPMRLNQQSHVQNQNVQNQLQQRSESIYGVRGVVSGASATTDSYPSRGNYSRNPEGVKYDENQKIERARPESMYGMVGTQSRRGQSTQSDDSSYGSYQGSSSTRNNAGSNGGYHANAGSFPQKPGGNVLYGTRGGGGDSRLLPPSQVHTQGAGGSYHHPLQQESSGSQY